MSTSHKNTPEEDEQELERLLAMPTYEQLQAKCAELERQVAAQQQQIAVYREAMLSVLCDPEGSPCFEGSDGDREVIRQALAQPFDTSA